MIIKIISYKEIFEKLVKERLDDIKELTDEIKHDCLTYYFKDNTLKKRFYDSNNSIKRFRKTQSNEIVRRSGKTAKYI